MRSITSLHLVVQFDMHLDLSSTGSTASAAERPFELQETDLGHSIGILDDMKGLESLVLLYRVLRSHGGLGKNAACHFVGRTRTLVKLLGEMTCIRSKPFSLVLCPTVELQHSPWHAMANNYYVHGQLLEDSRSFFGQQLTETWRWGRWVPEPQPGVICPVSRQIIDHTHRPPLLPNPARNTDISARPSS